MPDKTADVVVIVPTLGERVDTLGASLASALGQDDVRVRVVVVVPESATTARVMAGDMGATVVDDPGRGLSAAVNAGLDSVEEERYYAWLNDDDFLAPGALAALRDMLDNDPDASVAFGACTYIDPEGRPIGVSRAGDVATRILGWGPDLVPQPSALHRLAHVRRAGRYDETLRYAMDLDMLLRLRRLGPFLSTKRVVSSFRWHPESLTVANRRHSLAESEMVKHRYLSRRTRRLAPLWDLPVRLATHVAARQVNRKASKVALAHATS
ncbi:glycosyltransferase family 2 protein [Nocardioides iriomotensis]|uniref:4,4'-diaponeurosporenoate glycosyltransferase n=1 Tax=Nocardioides iriomotensis TaxID=715784 RepID=A0A4Q5IUL3_9ACTN|nr:glycosyltransferase [Nocardioides iriomotensis]RYU09600.1 glycosyltransferase [Nocardioides iriomotensis]